MKTGKKTVTKTVTVVLGSVAYKLRLGKSQSLQLRLNANGIAVLKTAMKKPLRETIRVTVKSGSTASKVVTVS